MTDANITFAKVFPSLEEIQASQREHASEEERRKAESIEAKAVPKAVPMVANMSADKRSSKSEGRVDADTEGQ